MEERYIFLPYLKTSKRLKFRDVEFRPTLDFGGLDADQQAKAKELTKMFFIREGMRIKEPSWAYVTAKDENGINQILKQAKEFQTLIRYEYSSPHEIFGDPFLTSEHGTMYVLKPGKVDEFSLWYTAHKDLEDVSGLTHPKPDFRHEFDGYSVLMDFKSYFTVSEGSRIYPPCAHVWLNLSQDLYSDVLRVNHTIHEDLWSLLSSEKRDEQMVNRILTALRWYNRSIQVDAEDEIELASLAIAFEALLGLRRGDSLSKRFKEAIVLLLGNVDRLESWIEQFYDARSNIVHTGDSDEYMFRATDSGKDNARSKASRYRSLVSFGRTVFQLCACAIARGARISSKARLSSLLETNKERFVKLNKVLSNESLPAGKRLIATSEIIEAIEKFRFVSEEDLDYGTLIGAAKLAAKDALASGIEFPASFKDSLNNLCSIVASSDPDHFLALSSLNQIDEEMKLLPRTSQSQRNDLQNLLTTLLYTVWQYSFMRYFHLKDLRKKPEASSNC